MDDFYLNGFKLAFFIGLIKICISVSALLSQRARNLKKIGLYYSCMQGAYTSSTPTGAIRFIFYLAYMLILAPLFSWISVFSASWGIISWLSNRTSVPESIKEIQYKLAHVELSKDQIIELQAEVSKVLGVALPIHANASDDNEDPFTYVLDPSDWYSEVRVNIQDRQLVFYGHTPDYDSIYNSTYEYRFEGSKLMARLLEDNIEHYGKYEYRVRDNVVLESEIRKRHAESKFKIKDVHEELDRFKAEVEWSEFKGYEVRFFAMAKHPDLFPSVEYKKAIRKELERVQNSSENFISKAREIGAVVIETDKGIDFKFPEHCDESKKEQINNLFKAESMSNFGITIDEINFKKKIEKDLLAFLGEKKAA